MWTYLGAYQVAPAYNINYVERSMSSEAAQVSAASDKVEWVENYSSSSSEFESRWNNFSASEGGTTESSSAETSQTAEFSDQTFTWGNGNTKSTYKDNHGETFQHTFTGGSYGSTGVNTNEFVYEEFSFNSSITGLTRATIKSVTGSTFGTYSFVGTNSFYGTMQQSGSTKESKTSWSKTEISPDGTTTQSSSKINATTKTGFTAGTYVNDTNIVNNVTGIIANGITANTDTYYIAEGYIEIDGYPSTTESAVISTEYAGSVTPGTVRSIGHSNEIFTLISDWGTGTIRRTKTTEVTYTIAATTFTKTTDSIKTYNQSYWNGTATAVRLTQRTISSTTSRYANAGEIVTEGQTYLLYADPVIGTDRKYTQALYVVADTKNGEFLWDCSANTMVFESGNTYASKEFTNFGGYFVTKIPVGITRDYSESWPMATVFYSLDHATAIFNTNGTKSDTNSTLEETVLNGTAGVTTKQTFFKSPLITNDSAGYNGVEEYESNGKEGAIITYATTTTQNVAGANLGVAIIWDGGKFTTQNQDIVSSAIVGITSVSALGTVETVTQANGNARTNSAQTDARASYEIEFIGTCNGINRAERMEGISVHILRPVGPRAQIPPGLGFSESTEANSFGNITKYYTSIVSVDGATLLTPLIYGQDLTKKSGISSSTYSWNAISQCVIGTSATITNSTETFSESFSVSPVDRVMVTSRVGYYQATQNDGYGGTVGSPVWLGNKESWTGARGVVTFGVGAGRWTTENNNSTGLTTLYPSYSLQITINDINTAHEPAWVGTKTTENYSPNMYPSSDILLSTHRIYTA